MVERNHYSRSVFLPVYRLSRHAVAILVARKRLELQTLETASPRTMVGLLTVAKLRLLLLTLKLVMFSCSVAVSPISFFQFSSFQASCSDTEAHATIVTKVDGSNVYISCHSSDAYSANCGLLCFNAL